MAYRDTAKITTTEILEELTKERWKQQRSLLSICVNIWNRSAREHGWTTATNN